MPTKAAEPVVQIIDNDEDDVGLFVRGRSASDEGEQQDSESRAHGSENPSSSIPIEARVLAILFVKVT